MSISKPITTDSKVKVICTGREGVVKGFNDDNTIVGVSTETIYLERSRRAKVFYEDGTHSWEFIGDLELIENL